MPLHSKVKSNSSRQQDMPLHRKVKSNNSEESIGNNEYKKSYRAI